MATRAVRTATGKLIKTGYLSANGTCTSAEGSKDVLGSLVFQDDIRIIGFEITSSILYSGAITESEGMYRVSAGLTRVQGGGDQVVLATAKCAIGHLTAQGHCGQYHAQEVVMFPDGYGLDIDNTEGIYCYASLVNTGFASDAIEGSCEVRLYYVER